MFPQIFQLISNSSGTASISSDKSQKQNQNPKSVALLSQSEFILKIKMKTALPFCFSGNRVIWKSRSSLSIFLSVVPYCSLRYFFQYHASHKLHWTFSENTVQKILYALAFMAYLLIIFPFCWATFFVTCLLQYTSSRVYFKKSLISVICCWGVYNIRTFLYGKKL